MNAKSDYIAVFDSGVGGISVLRHLMNTMPGERYLYFGDSANAPYGSRTTQEVQALTLTAIENLMAQYPIKAVVVACNTATAAAIRLLRHTYPKLIIIGIEPALKVAADHFPGGRIGVMATDVTLREEKFDSLLHRFDEECTITKIPAPGLVPLIEAGKVEGPEVEALLWEILHPYIGKLDAWFWAAPTTPSLPGPFPRCWGRRWFCWTAAAAPPGRQNEGSPRQTFWRKAAAKFRFSTALTTPI